ncbi:hypothetical protein JD844_013709 [Phrynosoma platyrhinos]|uniref:Uncharacterized protein n=1 Tax=Phrynosoma platyrhinos TaxID=52577 RepID=A0ABQ7TN10_PHRPL|nr:hypothetical protein JD844_013709 [Phrynosoma platyrhinos]
MSETQETKAVMSLIKEDLNPEIKIEEEEKEKELTVSEAGDVREGAILPKAKVKQEPDEGPSRNWDAQLQEFLLALQARPLSGGTLQLPELKQFGDPTILQMPFPRATVPNKWPRELWVSQIQPHLIGEMQADATHSGKGKEGALSGDASPDMTTQLIQLRLVISNMVASSTCFTQMEGGWKKVRRRNPYWSILSKWNYSQCS